jgi:hypothetical protein
VPTNAFNQEKSAGVRLPAQVPASQVAGKLRVKQRDGTIIGSSMYEVEKDVT